MKYFMTNAQTGDTVQVKEGWSWVSFFFIWLALFIRKQFKLGFIILGIGVAASIITATANLPLMVSYAISAGVSIFLGLKANELRIQELKEKGYVKVEQPQA